jgi:SAM-dependent methyltransferase
MTATPDPAAFGRVADAYERGRPEYPSQLLEILRPAGQVLDLAAGTGKLTRLLRASPARVVAVEPLAELREYLDADEVLDGRAEAIPLADAYVDLVTVGDAWHWFDHERAAAEVARVTKPGGRVALLWQTPDEARSPAWTQLLGPLLEPLLGDHPGFRDEQGRGTFDAHPAFDALTERRVPFVWRPSRARYVDYIGSASFVAALAPEDRRRVLGRVAAVVPEGTLAVPFVTRCWLTDRTSETPDRM